MRGLGAGLGLPPLLAKALCAVFWEDPGPAIGDQGLVDVEPISVDHGHDAAVTVGIHGLNAHLAASQQAAQAFGGHLAEWLPVFWRINAVQPNSNLLAVGNDTDGVTIADAHNTHRRGSVRNHMQHNKKRGEQEGKGFKLHPVSIGQGNGKIKGSLGENNERRRCAVLKKEKPKALVPGLCKQYNCNSTMMAKTGEIGIV